MKPNEIVLFIIFFLAAVFVAYAMWRPAYAPVSLGTRACTLEAKICPDGSTVGRTGPNCEFAACPATTATTTDITDNDIYSYNSGVQGIVLLGPTCPVVQDPPDPGCADKPYATSILVYRTGATSPYIIGNSDSKGVFRFSLPPGSYTLAAAGGTTLPRCEEVSVAVVPDEYSTIPISCDTGIR